MVSHDLAKAGSTGTGTFTPVNGGLEMNTRLAVVVTCELAGGTPALTWTVQGSIDGVNWDTLSLLAPDASVATSNAAVATPIATGANTVRYIDGLNLRFFPKIRINVSANTNVTFNAKLISS